MHWTSLGPAKVTLATRSVHVEVGKLKVSHDLNADIRHPGVRTDSTSPIIAVTSDEALHLLWLGDTGDVFAATLPGHATLHRLAGDYVFYHVRDCKTCVGHFTEGKWVVKESRDDAEYMYLACLDDGSVMPYVYTQNGREYTFWRYGDDEKTTVELDGALVAVRHGEAIAYRDGALYRGATKFLSEVGPLEREPRVLGEYFIDGEALCAFDTDGDYIRILAAVKDSSAELVVSGGRVGVAVGADLTVL
jgi:hypothetical protein